MIRQQPPPPPYHTTTLSFSQAHQHPFFPVVFHDWLKLRVHASFKVKKCLTFDSVHRIGKAECFIDISKTMTICDHNPQNLQRCRSAFSVCSEMCAATVFCQSQRVKQSYSLASTLTCYCLWTSVRAPSTSAWCSTLLAREIDRLILLLRK